MMTFGRQAHLGKFLLTKRDNTISSPATGRQYLSDTSSLSLTAEHNAFHLQAYLGAIYSAFEGYLLDVGLEMLTCFPDKLKNSEIKLQDYVQNSGDYIADIAEKQIVGIGYNRFEIIVETVMRYFQPKPLNCSAMFVVQEFKATRDLYVHNRGQWNAIYQSKAGPNARSQPMRGPMPLDILYLEQGTDAAITLVNEFHHQGPRQYERFTKTKSIEEMWKASALERVMPFSVAWDVDLANDVARPTNNALNWGWSRSETFLFDFFLAIFDSRHPKLSSTIQQTISRWPIETPSGQVILSWLRSPFYF